MWCIAKITPEYRERMYHLLDLYEKPYDPKNPKPDIDKYDPKKVKLPDRKDDEPEEPPDDDTAKKPKKKKK